MIVKTTFKSHFKIKKFSTKKNPKKIFVKNIFIFLLFSKIFFKKCYVSFNFKKNQTTNKINLLKAPSRHKKFFHQICYEYFQVVFIFKFSKIFKKNFNLIKLFNLLNNIFLKIGSNILNRKKISIVFMYVLHYKNI